MTAVTRVATGTFTRPIAGIGRSIRQGVTTLIDLTRFVGAMLRAASSYPGTARAAGFRSLVNQVRFTAVQALSFLGTIAALIGMTVIVQAHAQAVKFGVSDTLGRILVTVVVRELGPLLTAIIMIGRSGTAIAAEIATDRVLGETDAMEAMGMDPLQFLVVPRVVGGALSGILLTIYFSAITLTSGLVMAWMLRQSSFSEYLASLRLALSVSDLWVTAAKGGIFGAGIASLCCFAGLGAKRAPTEIPRRVTRGVVLSLLFVFIVSSLFDLALYA